MRLICLTFAGMLLIMSGQLAAQDSEVEQEPPRATANLKQKASYAIGLSVGSNLKRGGVDLDVDSLARGLKDSLSGKKPMMSEQEADQVMKEFERQIALERDARAKKTGPVNQREGEVFQAQNKGKQGVKTLRSGLQYRVLKQGNGPRPTETDLVKTHYRGHLINGKEFDSSYRRNEPAIFPVNGVIKGWTEALQLMPVGSKWELVVPAELAYGDRGAAPEIGPKSTLIFEVELLDIVKPRTGRLESLPDSSEQ